MRDYVIEGLPYRAVVKVEMVPRERLPRITELGREVLKKSGYDLNDPERGTHHLQQDIAKLPRAIAMLIARQGIKELQVGDRPAILELDQISNWVLTLPDEALVRLLQVCLDRYD